MANKILMDCVFLALLSCLTSGQEKFMVCKNIDKVFTDAGDEHPGSQMSRIQGPPGKKGVSGSPGPPGLPGIQGLPGNPATVDYDHISEMIEEKIRRGLEEVNLKIEMLKSNVTELAEIPNRQCAKRNGLLYEGKCYFTPYVSYSSSLTRDDAVEKCSNAAAAIAEIHSRDHQKALENFFRTKIPSSRTWIQFWTGMLYQTSMRNVRFRSGKEVSFNNFKWYRKYPSSSGSHIAIEFRKEPASPYNGLFNAQASHKTLMTLCEV